MLLMRHLCLIFHTSQLSIVSVFETSDSRSFEYARAHYGISSIPTAVPRKKVLLDACAGFDTDLWAGGMAEDHLPGASFGPVFVAIYAQQLHVLRAGDPFWFENPTYEMLSEEERETAKGTTLADV